jgi:hypothetical protein
MTTPWMTQRIKVALGNEANIDVVNHMVSGEDVNVELIGNVDQWPGHEGLQNKASNTPLTTPLYLVTDHKLDRIEFTNRCRLHQCSAYCLTKKIKMSQPLLAGGKNFNKIYFNTFNYIYNIINITISPF